SREKRGIPRRFAPRDDSYFGRSSPAAFAEIRWMFPPPFNSVPERRVRSRYVSFSVTGTVAQLVSLVKYSHFRSRDKNGYVSLAGVLIVSGRRRGGLQVPSFHDDA